MRLSFVILFLLTAFSSAQAQDKDFWKVKSVACSSGELNPQATLAVGSRQSPAFIRSLDQEMGTILEAGRDVVISVIASGDNTGACKNNNAQTIVTITLSK